MYVPNTPGRPAFTRRADGQSQGSKVTCTLGENRRLTRAQPLPNTQTPDALLPKLFGELRERYLARPGGYTRVLRTEPKDRGDQAPSAILELVDGQRDMRFAMTAATVARDEVLGRDSSHITKMNVKKLTAFRQDGDAEFRALVDEIKERDGAAIQSRAESERALQNSLYKFHIDRPKVRRSRRGGGEQGAESGELD